MSVATETYIRMPVPRDCKHWIIYSYNCRQS